MFEVRAFLAGSNFGLGGKGREIRSLFPRRFSHKFFLTLMEGRAFFCKFEVRFWEQGQSFW